MKAALLLLVLLSSPAMACDWVLTRETDPMTDAVVCRVQSESAKIEFYRNGSDRPNVRTGSAYSYEGLRIRVDDFPYIYMGENAWDRQKALDALLPQLATGQRIRVSFRDYPEPGVGDAAVCNLIQLLASC